MRTFALLRVPLFHDNVSVFLIHNDKQDERDFITLDKALKDGSVTITEKEHQQVGELQIDNQSAQPLFLQEGDRLSGGNQDRTIFASLVIPPKSGKMPLRTFCIEQGRWRTGSLGNTFSGTANAALAGKNVRLAAKVSKDQGRVWASVQADREVATQSLMAPSSTTSLNEALDSPQVKKASDDLAAALGGILKDHADAVGVAIAVNVNIEEVDV